MLPDPTLPAWLPAVLQNLRWAFTAPSFATFAALTAGLVANTGKGTVTGMLTGAGLASTWSHDRAHAFFSRASWTADGLGVYVSRLIVRTLLPDGAALTVAIDDTLFKRRGKKVFGAVWQHDGSARGQAGRLRGLLRRGRDHRRAAVPHPAGVPAGDGPAVASQDRPDQGRNRCVDGETAGGLSPRPEDPRRRGRRLPRQTLAAPARPDHRHHPAPGQRRALRPRPGPDRPARPAPAQRRPPGRPSRTRPGGEVHHGAGHDYAESDTGPNQAARWRPRVRGDSSALNRPVSRLHARVVLAQASGKSDINGRTAPSMPAGDPRQGMRGTAAGPCSPWPKGLGVQVSSLSRTRVSATMRSWNAVSRTWVEPSMGLPFSSW